MEPEKEEIGKEDRNEYADSQNAQDSEIFSPKDKKVVRFRIAYDHYRRKVKEEPVGLPAARRVQNIGFKACASVEKLNISAETHYLGPVGCTICY